MAGMMICMALGACARGAPVPLYAGTAKVDISPDQKVILANPGESFRLPDKIPPGPKTPPKNIHDPLYARVVVLKNNEVSLAIVTTDLIVFASKRVADEAKKQWGLDYVIQSSTHNHQGMMPRAFSPMDRGQWWSFAPEDPCVSLDWPGFSDDPWYAATEEKIIKAIGEATQDLFPARIVAGKGHYDSPFLGSNRRFVRPDGTVKMMWDNPNRIPTKPRDPTVGVVRIEDETGKPRVFMVHYACHPCTVMGGPMITADFPGTMCDYVEKELGDACMAMFLQGASGDIDSYEFKLRGKYGWDVVRQSGVGLAKAALRVAEELPASQDDAEVSMSIKENILKIPYRRGRKSSTICVSTLVFDDQLALVTIPGEIFIQHQLNLTKRSPVPNTFIMGLSYCGKGSPYIIYIPTAKAAEEGGYGATECSYVSADAGDRMMNTAVKSIKESLQSEPAAQTDKKTEEKPEKSEKSEKRLPQPWWKGGGVK